MYIIIIIHLYIIRNILLVYYNISYTYIFGKLDNRPLTKTGIWEVGVRLGKQGEHSFISSLCLSVLNLKMIMHYFYAQRLL